MSKHQHEKWQIEDGLCKACGERVAPIVSNERDELAREVFIADNSNSPNPAGEWDYAKSHGAQYPVDTAYAYNIADGLIAAGYRKTRTITTAEELYALPVGSVVLHNGRAFQHYPAYPAPFDEYQKWKCGDGGFVRSTKDGAAILPAVVLWEPEA